MVQIDDRNDNEGENKRLEQVDIDKEENNRDKDNAQLNEMLKSSELHFALINNNKKEILSIMEDSSVIQIADALIPLSDNEIILFYSINNNYDKLGEIFSYLAVDEKLALCNNLQKKTLQSVLNFVSNDDLADFLDDISKKNREKLLSVLSSKRRNIVEGLAKYSEDTVGSIMTTEYLSVTSGTLVKEIFKKIKEIGKSLETVRTIFILSSDKKLIGVERIEDMMFEDPNEKIDTYMSKDFPYISPIADKEQAIPICQEYDLPVLPVVSRSGEMLGILTFDDVMDVLEEANTEDVLLQAAVTPTEIPYMENKIYRIAFSYVIWLVILLIINTFTGMIISRFENALLTLPVLISFIPALNDSCGNSSSQTTAMIIRAITTEDIKKRDYPKIILKEFLTGLITGLILAVFNFFWVLLELSTPILNTDTPAMQSWLANFSSPILGYLLISIVISLSLLIGITLSKTFASILPMLAKALHIDPAVMSGPLITSLMDIITLLVYFSIATIALNSFTPNVLTSLAIVLRF